MTENNEKILKRAAVSDEESARVAGGKLITTEVCCALCGKDGHTADACPLKSVAADIMQTMDRLRNSGTVQDSE